MDAAKTTRDGTTAPARGSATSDAISPSAELGIYIQVPFCQTKCTYCNFHTGVAARSLYAPYARAIEREISEHAALYRAAGLEHAVLTAQSAAIDTIYLGGGTPSLLDPADLARIIGAVHAQFPCALREVTLEADPETIRPDNAAAWLAAGIHRISLGVQSFQDAELAAAGRMHRCEDIGRAICVLRSAGFSNLSVDLIAGLPHQTPRSWTSSVEQLLSLRPEHTSIYLLEVDEGSRLGSEVLAGGSRYSAAAIPDDDVMAACYEQACAELATAGYEHYEISNWALSGLASRHNLKYWRRQPYLGFGAGAHSFDGRWRWANAHDAAKYVAAIAAGRLPIEQCAELSRADALEEEMFLGLRQLAGIDLARIEQQYGVDFGPRIATLCAQGLVECTGTRVRLAPARLTVSNEVFVALLD
jgi:oxygen-independent coproporphyrinogen-3 oxidase